MKTTRSLAWLVLTLLSAACLQAQETAAPSFDAVAEAIGKAKTNLVQAIEIAEAQSQGGFPVSAELQRDGRKAWAVRFLIAEGIREVFVDPVDGKVLEVVTREVKPEHKQWATQLPDSLKKSNARVIEAVRLAESQTRGGRAYALICRPDAGQWYCDVSLWTPEKTIEARIRISTEDSPSPPTSPPTSRPATQPAVGPGGEVVIYCSVDVAFARPILDEFAKRTGLKVHPVFDTEAGKTTGLVNKLLAEKAAPRADVWWSGEVFGTMQLAAAGILAPYKSPVAADIPDQYKQPDGLWTAFGLRGRVLAFDPKRTKKEDLPKRWCDLVDPKYKGKFRMADPRFGTTRGHMATLLALWGPQAMTDFYRGLRANDCKLADGNSQAVLLLSRGMAEMVATDTDDVIVAKERGDSIDMIYPDLDAPAGSGASPKPMPGTLWIPNSVALVAGCPHAEAGRRLIDYLVSAEIEEKLHASESRNVPVRPALRSKLGAEAPGEAKTDYAAAAAVLDQSDKLVRDVLLQ